LVDGRELVAPCEGCRGGEEAARRVNGAYAIDATATPDGPRPAHIKERIRALGPTVRLDLSLDPTATPDRVL
jgi:hypothetical protein